MCGRVADRAVQIHGGAGYVSDYAIERFYRDVRLFRIYEGTSQIQQLVIARNMIREAKAVIGTAPELDDIERPARAIVRAGSTRSPTRRRGEAPGSDALREGSRTWTYAELAAGSEQAAERLAAGRRAGPATA